MMRPPWARSASFHCLKSQGPKRFQQKDFIAPVSKACRRWGYGCSWRGGDWACSGICWGGISVSSAYFGGRRFGIRSQNLGFDTGFSVTGKKSKMDMKFPVLLLNR